jgi:hypothetical protein
LLYSECFRWVLLITENTWKPQAFVIDGPRIEEKGIVDVFGSNSKVFNCSRHSLQPLLSKVGHIEVVLKCMKRALFASTKMECIKNRDLAISYCPSEDLKRYIRRTWPLDRNMIWRLHERQTGITAEVTTTNPIESYFSRVKKCVNSKMILKDATSNLVKLILSI